jgi:hypothetical protein
MPDAGGSGLIHEAVELSSVGFQIDTIEMAVRINEHSAIRSPRRLAHG